MNSLQYLFEEFGIRKNWSLDNILECKYFIIEKIGRGGPREWPHAVTESEDSRHAAQTCGPPCHTNSVIWTNSLVQRIFR